MSNRSITPVRRLPPAQRRDSGEIVTTRSSGGFLSFQYSYTEVSSATDGRMCGLTRPNLLMAS